MLTTALKRLGTTAALLLGIAGGLGSPAFAVTPDVRLPEWHALTVHVTEWNPAKGEVAIESELRSCGVPLTDLSAELHWPEPARSRNGGRQGAPALEAGKTWSVRHAAAGVTVPFDGWLELEVAARPDAGTLRKKLDAIATYTPAMRQVMNAEVAAISAPIPVGRSLPFYADKNIAVFMPRALLFTPVAGMGERALHLWIPEITSPAALAGPIGKLRASLGTAGAAPVLGDAVKAVDEAMAAAGDAVEVACGGEKPPFLVPLNVFREAMSLNRAVLAAANERGSAIALGRLERLVRQSPPGFATPFGWANLAVLQAEAGLGPRARDSFTKALELIPAWPLVRGWRDGLEAKK
ncbi:MAG TPA: hypothetical protein PLP29_03390 [Candidatus Ozemobacteraceae bacterium]|nr:hypothetical protein [Candidatus Ozemobacteraceae bacterium]